MFNSVHLYELCVLKKYALPLLEAIQPDEPEYSEAQRMRNFLRFFKTVEDDSAIVNNSILREFIGGSVFVDCRDRIGNGQQTDSKLTARSVTVLWRR